MRNEGRTHDSEITLHHPRHLSRDLRTEDRIDASEHRERPLRFASRSPRGGGENSKERQIVRGEVTELPTTLVSAEKMIEIVWPEEDERPKVSTIMRWARKRIIPSVQVRKSSMRWFNPARVRESLEKFS